MNDLAEKALRGLDTARRRVWTRPLLLFAVVGFACSSVVVVAGAEIEAARPTRALSSWLGLQDAHGVRPDNPVPGVIMLAGVAALVLLWLWVVEHVRCHDPRESRTWLLAACWAAPFALGPPLMGTTVYSYAAFGVMQRRGLSPYGSGPSRLGDQAIVAAIDPGARSTPSGSGPLATLVQHLAVSISSGGALGAVIVLRVFALLVAVVIARLAADLAGTRRARAITLTALNPLVLLYLVSAARLDGLMVALVLGALVAANQRRWSRAIILLALAGSVTGEAFFVLPAIIFVHLLGRRSAALRRALLRDLVTAAATVGIAGAVVTDGFGWLWTVHQQFAAHTPFAASSALAKLLSAVVRGASYDDLAAGARITALTALLFAVGYLVVTARQRALERTAGYSLLAVALLAPVLYPWYLLWGVLCLVPSVAGSRRIALLGLCAAGCVLDPPGFASTPTNVVTATALTVVAVLTATSLVLRRRARTPTEPLAVSAQS